MHAATYVRVSTGRQAEEGASLEAQRAATARYAEAQGWEVVEEFVDAGVSGRSVEGRSGMNEALARAAEYERLVVWKMSRFGRSARDTLNLIHAFRDEGVEVIFTSEGLDTSTSHGRFVLTLLAAVAEMEAENISVQAYAGMQQRASEGIWQGGPAPFGFTTDEDGRLVVDRQAQQTLQAAAQLILDGKTTGDAARWLTARNMLPPRSKEWKSSELRRHLTRRSLIGEVEWDGTVMSSPPVIDEDTFYAVQRRLEEDPRARPRQGKRVYPMSQRVVCTCGDVLISAGLRHKTHYYRCRSWTKPYDCDFTGQHWLPAEPLEDALWKLLVEEARLGFIGLPPRDEPDLDELKNLESVVQKLTNAYANALADAYIDDAHRRAAGVLQDRLHAAEAELSRARTEAGRAAERLEAVSDADVLEGVTDPEERLTFIQRLGVGWHVIPEEYEEGEKPRFELAWFG